MNYRNTNITNRYKAIALEIDSVDNLFNLPINIIILLGINIILGLIIING